MLHPTDVHVGGKVREARSLRGVSQEKLAERLGISFQQVQKYEKGQNRIGCSRLWDISQALEQPVAFFFAGLGETTGSETVRFSSSVLQIAKRVSEMPSHVRRPFLAFLNIIIESRRN